MYALFKWVFTGLAVIAFFRMFKAALADRPFMEYAQSLVSAMIAFSVMAAIALAMWLTV